MTRRPTDDVLFHVVRCDDRDIDVYEQTVVDRMRNEGDKCRSRDIR